MNFMRNKEKKNSFDKIEAVKQLIESYDTRFIHFVRIWTSKIEFFLNPINIRNVNFIIKLNRQL